MTKLHFLSMLPLLSLLLLLYEAYWCSNGRSRKFDGPNSKSACIQNCARCLPLGSVLLLFLLCVFLFFFFLICKLRFCVCFCMDIMYNILFFILLYSTRPRNWLESMAYFFYYFFTIFASASNTNTNRSAISVLRDRSKSDLLPVRCFICNWFCLYIWVLYENVGKVLLRRTVYVACTKRCASDWNGVAAVAAYVYVCACTARCWASRSLIPLWNVCRLKMLERELLLFPT